MSPAHDLDWPKVEPGIRTFGVIGWPIEHSRSPQIHEAAYRALDLPYAYVRLPVPPGAMEAAVARLIEDGYAGANVTMPHKEQAAALATSRTDDVVMLRAANTLSLSPDAVAASNTDVAGFADFLTEDAEFDPEGKTALVFGAGGAARACALALSRAGLSELVVAVRDRSAAGRLLDILPPVTVARAIDFGAAAAERPDLIVNATPLGSGGEALPLPVLGPQHVIVDLLYYPASTPLLASAQAAGARAFGGLGLLVRQAARSFEIWTGQPAPLEGMQAVLSRDSG